MIEELVQRSTTRKWQSQDSRSELPDSKSHSHCHMQTRDPPSVHTLCLMPPPGERDTPENIKSVIGKAEERVNVQETDQHHIMTS